MSKNKKNRKKSLTLKLPQPRPSNRLLGCPVWLPIDSWQNIQRIRRERNRS